jgi:pSer/pThr/pTyr-binding forkhead associated (FHA) protein
MTILLEIKAGPFAGKTLTIPDGKSLVVGRAPTRTDFAVPHDTFMSGIHFVVEAGPQGARVVDKKSSNGTFLNGARIQESPLKEGDEVRSGQTIFVVRIRTEAAVSPPETVAPQPLRPGTSAASALQPSMPQPVSPRPPAPQAQPVTPPAAPSPPAISTANLPGRVPGAAPQTPPVGARAQTPPAKLDAPDKLSQVPVFTVGSWAFHLLPEGWQIQKEFGFQQSVEEGQFPSSVVVLEEPLGSGVTLPNFVESQIGMLRQYLQEPHIEPAVAPAVEGSEESIAVDVRHKTKDGTEVFYRRVYVRRGNRAGVLTLTSLAKDSASVLESLQPFWAALAFRPQPG